jgi:hypothetical protein
VHVSRTATLFHVVDQLSAWSPFCHGQYARGLDALDERDRALLDKHRRVRERHPWGAGLEQAFYTPLELDEALREAVGAGHINAEEADVEREVFEHFAGRVDRLSAAEAARVDAFRQRIRDELPAMSELAGELSRLVGSAPPPVPVYLIPNPADHDWGGGYNGAKLTLEIPREADAWPTFLHEVFHAFLALRSSDLEAAAASAATRGGPALDYQTLNEGLAHALSPGLLHAGASGSDPLVERVRELERTQRGLDTYEGRTYRFALALRPLVRAALAHAATSAESSANPRSDAAEGEDRFRELVSRAVDAWQVLTELELARERSE